MNKRQYKKKIKKIKKFIQGNFDTLDENGNWHTIPIKCHSCGFFESGDSSVGLPDACIADVIFDKDDNVIPAMEEKVQFWQDLLGYGCPCFRRK